MKTKNKAIFSFSGKVLSGLVILIIITLATVSAQVQFPQTTNADFYKGSYNDLVVTNNSVSLPFQANGVGQWLTTTVLPQTLMGHKTATWNNRFVYVTGGFNGLNYSNSVYHAVLQAGGIGGYTLLSQLPQGLRDHAMVIGTNAIYVLGGRNDTEVFNAIHYATINTDGSLSDWQTLDVTLPTSLRGHTAVYSNGFIYVAGGAENVSGTDACNNVYCAQILPDNTLTEFSNTTDLPVALTGHTMVVQGEKVFVLGGFTIGGEKVSTVYSAVSDVSGELSAWTSETNLPVTVSNHSSVVMNGLITVLAGETNGTLNNTVYYADINSAPMSWNLAANVMYDYTRDGAAFSSNGQIGYCGGVNNSGSPIHNTRYANLGLSLQYEKNGLFVSNPFYELGANRQITELTFDKTTPEGTTVNIAYRTAVAGENWGPWTAYSATSPIEVNEDKQYLQYKVNFTSTGMANGSFDEMRLFTLGSQLAGNLNHIPTFTKAMSPYWATADIVFTAGTHTFEAGTEILFLPGVVMHVEQANIICQGTVADSVKFLGYTNTDGLWGGIYYHTNSDEGVSSQFHYTVIANGGHGTNNANLYCSGSNEPLLKNSTLRNSSGNGIRLNNSHINLEDCTISKNAENGLYLENSNPTLLNSSIDNNTVAGVHLTSTASVPTYHSTSISNNLYAIRYPSPNFTFHEPNGLPVLTGNTYNGIVIDGGNVTTSSKVWNSISYDYILLGSVNIGNNPAIRLTIEPGNNIKAVVGARIQVGVESPIWAGGELYAIGTADSTITFTSWDGNIGGWEGIYFQPRSDQNQAGPSVLDYVTIEKGNEYNYYADNTTSVHIKNSTIQLALLDGAKYLNSFGYIENCNFLNNGRYPLYLTDWLSSPVNKLNTYTGNNPDFIVLSGGIYTADRTVYFDGAPYWVQNDINLHGNWSDQRLFTIEAGVSLHFAPEKGLLIGYGGSSLIAEGTPQLPITFTAYNGESGGWNGILFEYRSSSYGNSSIMNHCIVEKGNEYNIYSENNTEPNIDNSTIQLAAGDGIRLFNSSPSIFNTQIINNGAYPINNTDWRCNPNISGNTYTGNNPNYIALSGGTYTSSFTILNDGVPYHVLDNIIVEYEYQGIRTLKLNPGVTLAFDLGKRLELKGSGTSYGSSLHAQGTADSTIKFTAFNGEVGGWEGIYFDRSGGWGNESSMKHCVVEKGNNYNIRINQTNQPTIENSIVRLAAQDGFSLTTANPSITNSDIVNNGRYPIFFTNWDCSPYISGNTYSDNKPDYIAFPGGTIYKSISFLHDGVPYHVLDNIIVDYEYQGIRSLTLNPGVTLAFEPGKRLEFKGSGTSYGSSLLANGSADNPITLTAYNGEVGGWEGIYFDRSGGASNESTMKHCVVEKGNLYNIRSSSTNQPFIESSIIRNALQDGLVLSNTSITLQKSSIVNNGANGILLDGTSNPVIGDNPLFSCNFYNNVGFDVYNNSVNNINARYNYWGTMDSTFVALKVFDKSDNNTKGQVVFTPFAHIPISNDESMTLSGTLGYSNDANSPMINAAMVIKDFDGNEIATTATNDAGVYAFGQFPSGSYQLDIVPSDPWGGVNATDALAILNHFAKVSILSGIPYAAANVNYSQSVNATDALFVMKRFAGLINDFPTGDYVYHVDDIYFEEEACTQNLKTLCFGDVNISYLPTGGGVTPAAHLKGGSLSASSSEVSGKTGNDGTGMLISLVPEGVLPISSFSSFDLPVTIETGMNVGAVSLAFIYPDEFLELEAVEFSDGSNNHYYAAQHGLVKIAWCDLNHLQLEDGALLVNLKMKALDLKNLYGNIQLEIYPNSELAEHSGQPAHGVVLKAPEMLTAKTGIHEYAGLANYKLYPNPTKGKANLSFSLSEDANVKVEVYNITGQCQMRLFHTDMTEGEHNLLLDASKLKPGVYQLKTTIFNGVAMQEHVSKMVISF